MDKIITLTKPNGVIAFPTDTVYGLGCLVEHEAAIDRIYAIKGRAKTKPLILMSYQAECFAPYLGKLTGEQQTAYRYLSTRYWPGALTLVLPKSELVPDAMTQGIETVGIRVPDCPFLLDILKTLPSGVLATTSANRSDEPEATTAEEVSKTLGNDVDLILSHDGRGSTQPSTVARIELSGDITILRQGDLVLD